jgi:hypothetical protein
MCQSFAGGEESGNVCLRTTRLDKYENNMRRRLVTIATFDQAAQARLAENALKDAGILAAVNDESLVAMDWLLSNAVGGVKVQVWEEDAEQAVAVLDRKFGEGGQGLGNAVSIEELTAQAELEEPEEPIEEAAPETPSAATAELSSDSRENYSRRLVFAGMLGIIFPPVAAYAVYILLNAVFGEGPLSSRGRFNIWVGALMAFSGMAWFSILLGFFL